MAGGYDEAAMEYARLAADEMFFSSYDADKVTELIAAAGSRFSGTRR